MDFRALSRTFRVMTGFLLLSLMRALGGGVAPGPPLPPVTVTVAAAVSDSALRVGDRDGGV